MGINHLRDLQFQSVVFCTDLFGEGHLDRWADRVMTPGSIDGIMVNTLAQDARDVGFNSRPHVIFSTSTAPTTPVLRY